MNYNDIEKLKKEREYLQKISEEKASGRIISKEEFFQKHGEVSHPELDAKLNARKNQLIYQRMMNERKNTGKSR